MEQEEESNKTPVPAPLPTVIDHIPPDRRYEIRTNNPESSGNDQSKARESAELPTSQCLCDTLND